MDMVEKARESLERLGYKVSVFDSGDEAVAYLDNSIDNTTVGIGGSMTVQELGLYDKLSKHNSVYWHWVKSDLSDDEARRAANAASVYISSVNGLGADGAVVNIDGIGNRVGTIFYGHDKVYLIVGENKIAEDCEAALWRARNVASPLNARRFGVKTPCVSGELKCYDCKSKDRICRCLSILWQAPMRSNIEVVLIKGSYGY